MYEFNWNGSIKSRNQLESSGRISLLWSTSDVHLAAYGNRLIAGVAGNVYCLDMNNGLSLKWKRVLSSASETTSVLVTGNGHLYAGHNGRVYELNILNGDILNHNDLPGTGEEEVRLAYAPPFLFAGTNGWVCQLYLSDISRGLFARLHDASGNSLAKPITLLSGSDSEGLAVYAGCGGYVFRIQPIPGYGAVNIVQRADFRSGHGQEVSLAQPLPGGTVYAGSAAAVIGLNPNDLSVRASRIILPFVDAELTHLLGYGRRLFAGCQSYTYELDTDDLDVLNINPIQDGSYASDNSYHIWGVHDIISSHGLLNRLLPAQVDLTAGQVGGLDILVSGVNGYLFDNLISQPSSLTTTVSLTPTPNAAGWIGKTFASDPVVLTFSLPNRDNYLKSDTIFVQRSDHAEPDAFRLPKLDNAGTPTWQEALTDLPEGVTTLTYYSVDAFGSKEAPRTYEVRIDRTLPTSEAAFVGNRVQLASHDTGSGVGKFVYWFDQSAPQSQTVFGDTLKLNIPTGAHVLSYYAVDRADNVERTAHIFDVVTGRPTPQTTLTMLKSDGSEAQPSAEGWYTTNQARLDCDWPGNTLTYYSIDEPFVFAPNSSVPSNGHSGIADPYGENGQHGYVFTVPFGAHTLYYFTRDTDSGAAGPVKVKSVNVDATRPVTTASVAGRVVTLSATDTGSGVRAIYYSVDVFVYPDRTTYTAPFAVPAGRHKVWFYSEDKAGNADFTRSVTVDIAEDVTANLKITCGGLIRVPGTTTFTQKVTLKNTGPVISAIAGPLALVLDNLPSSISLLNASGTTSANAPVGSPYVDTTTGLAGGQSATLTLKFSNPQLLQIRYTPRVLAGTGTR